MKLKIPATLLSAFCVLLIAPASSLAQQYGGPGNYWGPHMMWGGGLMGGSFMILFWILVIVAIFLGIRWAMKSGGSMPGPDRKESALEVLKRRYASGEIDRDQFLNMKKDLES
jgi:putative membrane protein